MSFLSDYLNSKTCSKYLERVGRTSFTKSIEKNSSDSKKLSDKYTGKLPSTIAKDLQKHIDKSREERYSNI